MGLKDIKKDKYGNIFGNLLGSCTEYEFFGVCVTVIHLFVHPSQVYKDIVKEKEGWIDEQSFVVTSLVLYPNGKSDFKYVQGKSTGNFYLLG